MKVRICAFKHSLVPEKKGSIWLYGGGAEFFRCVGDGVCCCSVGVCPRITEDECVFSHLLRHHQISNPSRRPCWPEALWISLKRLPRIPHVNHHRHLIKSQSCSQSQFRLNQPPQVPQQGRGGPGLADQGPAGGRQRPTGHQGDVLLKGKVCSSLTPWASQVSSKQPHRFISSV